MCHIQIEPTFKLAEDDAVSDVISNEDWIYIFNEQQTVRSEVIANHEYKDEDDDLTASDKKVPSYIGCIEASFGTNQGRVNE